jgi:hypothetical protein
MEWCRRRHRSRGDHLQLGDGVKVSGRRVPLGSSVGWTRDGVLVMAVVSIAGVVMAVVMGRHRAVLGTLADAAASAAAVSHTLPTSATAAPHPAAPGRRDAGTRHD